VARDAPVNNQRFIVLPMPSLFIIAHAPLASAFQSLAAHAFADDVAALRAFDVPAGADVDGYLEAAERLLDSLPPGDVLLLTDVFGATPCNIARRLADLRGLRVLVGLNVPMLWRALNYRHKPLDELAMLAMAGASQGVMQLTATRPQNQVQKPPSHDPNHGHHQQ
jgi:PTS system mannose-specific IIA component